MFVDKDTDLSTLISEKTAAATAVHVFLLCSAKWSTAKSIQFSSIF